MAEASGRQTETLVEIVQIGAAQVPPLNTFEIGPDALIRVKIGRVAWQLLQAQPPGATLAQEVLDGLTAMDRRSIPDHQQLTGHVPQQVAQEDRHLWTAGRRGPGPAATGGQSA